MSSTARADMVAHIRTVLLARAAASPTLLRKVYNSRPGAFPETPAAYIGPRDEALGVSAQVRTRQFSGLSAVIVDAVVDASEEADRMDLLIDLLVADFATNRNVSGGGGKLELSSISDTDITLQGPSNTVTYRGAVLTFGNAFISEGLETAA
jgi:hypothetical protein